MISPPHLTTPHLHATRQAQKAVTSEGPGPRDGEKEGKECRTRAEVEENKMEMKRKVEGGSQRRRVIQRGGKRRKQKRLWRKAEEDRRRNTPLRDASPSFYLSNLKLESKAIYQNKKCVFFSAQTTVDKYEGSEMNSTQGPLHKFPLLPVFLVSSSFLIQVLALLSLCPNLDFLAWPLCSK